MSNAIVLHKLETIKIVPPEFEPIPRGDLSINSDVAGSKRNTFRLRMGEQMGFASMNIWLVRFDDQVEVTLFQGGEIGPQKTLGSVTVPSSQLDNGERNFHFTENGADVVLTYFVRKWPCD